MDLTPPPNPAPGSPEAVAMGCKCDSVFNLHGHGTPRGPFMAMFAVNTKCPLHGEKVKEGNEHEN